MTDLETLTMLMEKGGLNIRDYIDEGGCTDNEIHVYLGEYRGYGVSFFFDKESGELVRCEGD